MTELDTQVVKYDITSAKIQAMEDEYKKLPLFFLFMPPKEVYGVVVKVLADCRGKRTATEKRRLELTKKARDYTNEVNGTGKGYISRLQVIEEPFKAMKKFEDDKELAIEAEEKRLDDERIAKIMARITAISDLNSPEIINKTSAELEIIRDTLIDLEIKGEDFEEHSEHAERVKANVLTVIQKAYDERLEFEAAAVKAKEEADRLAEVGRVQAAREKAFAEKEADLAKKEAKIKAEEDRKEREEFERKAKEEAKVKAEQEALKPDKEKLLDWVNTLTETVNLAPRPKDKNLEVLMANAFGDIMIAVNKLRSDIENL